jgi:hypothetical protein
MDGDDSYLDSLAGGWPLPLSGNPPDDSNQNHDERQRGGAMTFAATPPDYNGNRSYRTRSSVRTGDRSEYAVFSQFPRTIQTEIETK